MATLTVALGPQPSNSQAEILPTHTAALFEAAVKRAAELLRAGEAVALPTDGTEQRASIRYGKNALYATLCCGSPTE